MGECLPLAYFLLIIIIFALLPKKKAKVLSLLYGIAKEAKSATRFGELQSNAFQFVYTWVMYM